MPGRSCKTGSVGFPVCAQARRISVPRKIGSHQRLLRHLRRGGPYPQDLFPQAQGGLGTSFRMADGRSQRAGPGARKLRCWPFTDFQKQAEQVLLQRYAPPALVIDSDLRVVHFQGDTSPFLALSTGPPTIQLLKMLRPEFVMDLRSAISKAKREGATVSTEPIHFEHGGQATPYAWKFRRSARTTPGNRTSWSCSRKRFRPSLAARKLKRKRQERKGFQARTGISRHARILKLSDRRARNRPGADESSPRRDSFEQRGIAKHE